MRNDTLRRELVRPIRRTSWAIGEFVYRELGNRFDVSPNGGREDGEIWTETDSIRPGHVCVRSDDRPFRPQPPESVENPVVTVSDVTDYGKAEFVADPFLFVSKTEGWNLFFEVFNRDRRPTGVIGHATSDDRGRSWTYDGVVLRDDVHLAFPYVFEWENSFYMIPDRWNREQPAAIRLFRTESLPDGWRPVSTVVDPDRQLADCVVFRWSGKWWALLGSDDGRHELYAYYTEDLLDDGWNPHRDNPVVSGRPTAARPAGRPTVCEDRVVVFLQDCAKRYGDKVRAYEIERLTPDEYVDRERPESPILEGTGRPLDWNGGRMHHIDPWYAEDGWVCAVDGNIQFGRRAFGSDHWAIGIYRA